MRNAKGTPKTLKQAIENGRDEQFIDLHVQDFIAQKFATAMISASKHEVSMLEDLWAAIVDQPEQDETIETKVDLRAS